MCHRSTAWMCFADAGVDATVKWSHELETYEKSVYSLKNFIVGCAAPWITPKLNDLTLVAEVAALHPPNCCFPLFNENYQDVHLHCVQFFNSFGLGSSSNAHFIIIAIYITWDDDGQHATRVCGLSVSLTFANIIKKKKKTKLPYFHHAYSRYYFISSKTCRLLRTPISSPADFFFW